MDNYSWNSDTNEVHRVPGCPQQKQHGHNWEYLGTFTSMAVAVSFTRYNLDCEANRCLNCAPYPVRRHRR